MFVHANRFGLTFGFFIAFWHLVWVILIALGIAQAYMDWIFGLHMIEPSLTIGDFDFTKAFMLVVMTFVIGYVFGLVLGVIWKMCVMKKK